MGETCKHCKKRIIRCETLPSHFGCSSARGYVHVNPRAHACEPRSDGPYAEPVLAKLAGEGDGDE